MKKISEKKKRLLFSLQICGLEHLAKIHDLVFQICDDCFLIRDLPLQELDTVRDGLVGRLVAFRDQDGPDLLVDLGGRGGLGVDQQIKLALDKMRFSQIHSQLAPVELGDLQVLLKLLEILHHCLSNLALIHISSRGSHEKKIKKKANQKETQSPFLLLSFGRLRMIGCSPLLPIGQPPSSSGQEKSTVFWAVEKALVLIWGKFFSVDFS